MGMNTIENEKIRVTIADHGAELISIYDKKNEREVMWQADPAFWNRHAPILFPNVGQHYNKRYLYHGQTYPAGQHGFARDMDFTLVGIDETSVTHVLKATEETKKVYPFDFELEVTHSICEGHLTVGWKVVNRGENTMYFTIGGHPAFNVPVLPDTKQSDYYIQFAQDQDALTYILIDTSNGTGIPEETHELLLTDHKYQIREDMFDNDALVFDDGQIKWVGITMPDGSPYVAMKCDGFPNFGIWSKPGAPYVCLEPWIGRCDDRGFNKDISEKKGINVLKEGEIFERSYEIIVY
ncbi:MAG: aldose 1-epimerase family protein [Muricoprocola sp.]